jgi:hypothetical protein
MKSSTKLFSKMLWAVIFNQIKAQNKTVSISALAIVVLFCTQQVSAQSMLDVSVGTSHQDNFFTNLAYRYQVSDKFRIGFEAQYGAPKYRFVEAKPIREGYSGTVSVPLTLRLYEKEQIRLDFYSKVGMRFQGILDPDKNDKRDSILNSTAFAFEPGLLVTVMLNEKVNFQSGVTFPVLFQTSPSSIFENVYPGMIHLGLNYKSSEKRIVFAKALFGGATGGDGDTQKFGWSLQAGFRFNFGQKPSSSFVEPSF